MQGSAAATGEAPAPADLADRQAPPGPPSAARSTGGWRRRVPDTFARVLVVLALLCSLAAVSAAVGPRVQPVRALIDDLLVPAPANIGYAVFVAMLAAGVHNRKRVAYWLLIAYFGLQFLGDAVVVVMLLSGMGVDLDIPPRLPWLVAGNMVLTAGILAVLVISRREFSAKVQRASLLKAVATLVGLLLVFSTLGWGLVETFPGSLRGGHHVGKLAHAVREVTGGAFSLNVHRAGMAPGWVNLLLGLLGAVALLVAFWVLLRSQHAHASLDTEEERKVRDLLAAHGERDSLGYFATRRDKEVIVSATGKAAVTYRVVVGVSLASGDPLGDPEAWGPAVEAWLREAREYAWTPAVMGASEVGATAYARAGLRVLELGDEAILHVADFTLDGREMRQVRQAVHRVRRAGYTVRIRRHADIPPAEMARIIELAARWRDTETERGFSMALGRLGDPADGRCVLVEAHDAQGRESALLSFAPWGHDGLSLDLMRRDRASDNGLMEFMVAALMADAPRLGVVRVSLNFAVFRAVFEEGARIGAGPVLRAWRRLLLFLSRWFQLEALYRSNVKYRPEWVPRFLCFEDVRDLAKVGLASGIAEGFLVVPSLRTLLRRGRGEVADPVHAVPPPVPGSPTPYLAGPAATASATAAAAATAGDTATATASATPPVPLVPVGSLGMPAEPGAPPAGRRSEQVLVRLAKLHRMRGAGMDPYPPAFPRTHACGAVRDAHAALPPGTHTGHKVSVAGRVVLQRNHGGLCFATLRDWAGDLQVMLAASTLGRESVQGWKATVDLGDHVGVSGEVVMSKRGEVSVLADSWAVTAKCLHPLPDKQHGLTDPETVVRHRHLDLIVNPSAREMLRVRSAAVHALRTLLIDSGYLEVETPILQRIHGGANARPFITQSNAYDMRLYLRIAPELYLKRLAVGGVEKVFELGRDFRNEGADASHNPEFTMLEAYQAYGDYATVRELAGELVRAAAVAAHGDPVARRAGVEVTLDGAWPVITVHDAISAALGERVDVDTALPVLRRLGEAAGVPLRPDWNVGQVVLELYEHLVEARTQAPTFYTDFPTGVSPLTRAHRDDPRLAERWDLVAFGTELGTGYTELIDPVEQRRRLTEQSLHAAGGDPEAMQLDEDFLQALEYAMPPTGGLGLGVDRLVMLLTGATIRETLPFPLAKPRD